MPKLINDDELVAMATVVTTLNELNPDAQERVIAYLVGRYCYHHEDPDMASTPELWRSQ